MPLSDTANETPTLSSGARSAVAFSATLPVSVNFTALSIRFSRAARKPTGSPITKAARPGEISTDDRKPFAAARPASESPALCASARKSKKSWRSPRPELPLRAASTNRVASAARCSAPALMVSTQRRSRGPRPEVAKRSLMARMPVNGVRTSWAKAASAVSTMLGDFFAGRLRAGAFARVFRAGVFCLPPLRGERDMRAMIPPTRPACILPRPGRMSHLSERFGLAICCGRSRQADHVPDVGRGGARGAQLAQAGGTGRFRELLPGVVQHQPMVAVDRFRQIQQFLQQAMHRCRREQVEAARHMRDALQRVVDYHRKMIAGRRLLAREDDVAPRLRLGGHRAGLAVRPFALFAPAQIAGAGAGGSH